MSDSSSRTSTQIRQDFLDFFKTKEHTVVTSSSLMPDAPNLLFTNAGMNQFVPIFLGEQSCPYTKKRATDTQKCIRAGGKHNDLEDVGMDTYHHTFFEMLGNWSFSDYFKKEAIQWSWELLTEVWEFPKERLYATVYSPGDGEPGEFDQESYDYWAEIFITAKLDPEVHIVNGSKNDNFWMMGDTGPCGPCSELHIDLTPKGDSKGSLVNADSGQCIEIWNLVFIQYNANEKGVFTPLAAKHVDTGMGFERVVAVIQSTKNFTDFNKQVSNYDTDIFKPIFTELEKISGKKYTSTLPSQKQTDQEKIDIAFRVIGDHIRTLSFSIADGILPGNNDRNYVLRRILRRAVRYGRTLGFKEPFFYRLVGVLVESMGSIFPEITQRHEQIEQAIRAEEESFNKTLDHGIELFHEEASNLGNNRELSGEFVFKLYDTYGFPPDLTELMARESGITIDFAGFNELMNSQRERARSAQKKKVISVSSFSSKDRTDFIGFDGLSCSAKVLEVIEEKTHTALVLDRSPFFAEMGGQVGDIGILSAGEVELPITDTQKIGDAFLHFIKGEITPEQGSEVYLCVDTENRAAIQRHHTVTHLFHWALHEVTSPGSSQKGSYVGPDKLTFDFNSQALTVDQLNNIERMVNQRILDNSLVSWTELPQKDISGRDDIMQFFGDKYGEMVRVVQIGGEAGALNGYSMELCGGTHTRATGEIGLFRIISESAIASGVRRVEALAGLVAAEQARTDAQRIGALAEALNSPVKDIEKKLEQALEQSKQLDKQMKSIQHRRASDTAKGLIDHAIRVGDMYCITANLGDTDGKFAQAVADALKCQFEGVVVLGATENGNVALVASVSDSLTSKVQAGKIIQTIAPIVGGKGGGKPTQARGGGKNVGKLDEAIAEVQKILAN